MKNLRSIVQRPSSPKGSGRTVENAQVLATQRGKDASQNLYKKYNQGSGSRSKQTIVSNKYRIVTEPVDDHFLQITKSYSKLSKSNRRGMKFESQHVSTKGHPKSISVEKVGQASRSGCIYCRGYQNELKLVQEQIKGIVELKEQWKKGEILIDRFVEKASQNLHRNQEMQSWNIIQEVRQHMLDLMKDIEVLAEIDYPKLLSYNVLQNAPMKVGSEEEEEIKLLFGQLREQVEGKITFFDFEEGVKNERLELVIRNLKVNIGKCLRENLELNTKLTLSKKDVSPFGQEIERAVTKILRGMK